MKKTLFVIFAGTLILSGCKKNYSCACTTKLSQPGYLPYQTSTTQDLEKKRISKKKAAKICDNTAKHMQANTRLLFDSDVDVSTGCALQEK